MPEFARTLMTKDDMDDGVQVLADCIAAANVGEESIALVGIFTRGVPLAKRIAAKIEKMGLSKVFVGTIDLTQYRDDLNTFQMVPKLEGSDIPFSIDDAQVVLCDEVIFTARSVRAAIDELLDHGRPARVQLAVLIDREGREFPIQPDYVGIALDTRRLDHVLVSLEGTDGKDEIQIVERENP